MMLVVMIGVANVFVSNVSITAPSNKVAFTLSHAAKLSYANPEGSFAEKWSNFWSSVGQFLTSAWDAVVAVCNWVDNAFNGSSCSVSFGIDGMPVSSPSPNHEPGPQPYRFDYDQIPGYNNPMRLDLFRDSRFRINYNIYF